MLDSKTKKALKIALPLVLAVVLIWYSLSKISISELLEHFKNANYSYILLGVFCGFLSHLSRAYRWRFMLEPMGYAVKLQNSIMAVFSAYLINFTIPRAGEVARASFITNYESVPFEKGFGTIVAERVADMIMMLGIIAITLVLQFDFIYGFLLEKFQPKKILLLIGVLVALSGFVWWILKSSKAPIILKIKTFVSGLIEGVLSIFKMKKKWAFIGHTLFIWIMYVLMFYITSLAIQGLHPVPFAAILIGFILASFSIAATNGGIGSFPEAIVIAFLLFNLDENTSRAFGWIMWSSQTLMIMICGGVSLLYFPFFNSKNKLKNSINKNS